MIIARKSNIIYISIFFVIVLIVGSWFAISITKNMLVQGQLQKNSSDFFMRDVLYTQRAEDGSIQSQMRSPKIVHYPLADTYILSSPQLIMVDTNKHTWRISADNGTGKKNGEEIHLWDNVNIVQQGLGIQQEVMKVVTSAATIYPKQKMAYTDKPLTIAQAGTVVNAVGAEVNFRASTVKLLSKVQGQYEPSNSNH